MPHLKSLDVEYVSLVDRAACRDAVEQSQPMRFYLWKREDPSQGGHSMSKLTDELLKQLGEPVAKQEDLAKLVEKAEQSEEVSKAMDGVTRLLATHKGDLTPEILAEVAKAAGLELPEAEAPVLKAETTSELIDVLKSAEIGESVIAEVEAALEKAAEKAEIAKADPETRARLEKAEARAEKAEQIAKEERDARLEKEFVAKAEELTGSLPTTGADLGPVLKEANEKLDKASYERLEELLKAANAGIESGELFKEQGAGGAQPAGDAFEEATRKAEEIRKADPKLSDAEALQKALESDPDLQQRYLAEVR